LLVKIIKFLRCFYYGMLRNELFLRSAALTYYAIFSIFPLTILVTTAVALVLQDPAKQQSIFDALIELMPQGTEIITDMLQSVVATSTVTSIIAVLTLLWSATGFLRGLLSAIDLIHSRQYTYSPFIMRGIGVIVIILAVPALFLLLLLAGLSQAIVQAFTLPPNLSSILNFFASGLPVFTVAVIAFFLMLRFIPVRRTSLRVSLISSLITASAWVALGYGFSWYLSSGFADFNLIYGSIGAVMALMLYIYLSNVTILFGAQINASLAYFEDCTTPYIPGLDDALKLLHLPLPPIDEEEGPPNKPTIAP
jgi:membrane protein